MSEPAPARPEDERGDETDDADDDEDHPCSLYVDPRHLSVDRPGQDGSDGDEEDAQADSHLVTPFAGAESDAGPVAAIDTRAVWHRNQDATFGASAGAGTACRGHPVRAPVRARPRTRLRPARDRMAIRTPHVRP